MPRSGLVAAVVIVLFAAACGGSRLAPDDPFLQRGREIYLDNCLVCHQAGGEGVAGMQPGLRGSPKVLGDPETLARWILLGSAAQPTSGGRRYQNVMPAFDHLADEDVAAVATYVRQLFGGGAAPVRAATVAAARGAAATR